MLQLERPTAKHEHRVRKERGSSIRNCSSFRTAKGILGYQGVRSVEALCAGSQKVWTLVSQKHSSLRAPSSNDRLRVLKTSGHPSSAEGGFILELDSVPNPVSEGKPTVDAFTIEMKSEVRSRDRGVHGLRSKRREARAALVPHASVDDAIRTRLAELASQHLGHTVVVRIVGLMKSVSNIVKACGRGLCHRPSTSHEPPRVYAPS